MSLKICIDSFVVAKKNQGDIKKNSIGLVKAINGDTAMVYFIGKNQIERFAFDFLEIIDIKKTGKGYLFKICNICHILKTKEEFDINQTDAKGLKTTRPSCKECRKTIDGKQILPNENLKLEKIKPPLHSIFVCPICEKRSIVGITANLVKDHDHQTGLSREWICDSCNTGLGRFNDNVDFLQNVIDYLNKFKK